MAENGGTPSWEPKKFASWLRRYLEAEGMTLKTVADRGGIQQSSVSNMARGSASSRPDAAPYSPSIQTLIGLAHGLDLDLPYVMTRAGVPERPRILRFSVRERELLHMAIGTALEFGDVWPLAVDQELRRLQNEIQSSMPTSKESNADDE